MMGQAGEPSGYYPTDSNGLSRRHDATCGVCVLFGFWAGGVCAAGVWGVCRWKV
jgi:hypothetical protein